MAKVLVTGGAGFIGSHTVEKFLEADHEVIVVDNLSRGKKENLPAEVEFHQIDVGTEDFETLVAEKKPDFVSHQAAQISVETSVKNPIYDAQQNILGFLRVLEASRKNEVKGVILASSVAVYGEPNTLPVLEKYPLLPLSPYGLSKLSCEAYASLYHRLYSLKTILLRYGNVYGPRQDETGEAGVVAIFISQLLRGEVPTINGDGNQTRDFVYVEDVAHSNVLSLDAPAGVYNIGTGKEFSVKQLFQLLQKALSAKVSARHGPPRQGDIKKIYLDCEKARQKMGWEAKVSFAKGLALTINYFKKKYGL